ncbi:MAG: DUF4301 family protein [Candidatus Aureabacteria bacterium]|nr:DUF4301 family protein [Candidatus Auribacterota bacterium]
MTSFIINQKDLKNLEEKGISPDTVQKQIDAMMKGVSFVKLIRPCIPAAGITVLDASRLKEMAQVFMKESPSRKVMKFVPASGAGSRMFQPLLSLLPVKTTDFKDPYRGRGFQTFHHVLLEKRLENLEKGESQDQVSTDKDIIFFQTFITRIREFPFYPDIQSFFQSKGDDVDTLIAQRQYTRILNLILGPEGMNLSDYPKALLKFHRYPDHARTALEEQCVEALDHAVNQKGKAAVHFTFSREHLSLIKDHIKKIRSLYETGGKKLDIRWSVQKESTETVALDMHNQPLRDEDSNLVFRPGGHGALLENLNELQGDIIFIKNIDNIVPDSLKQDTLFYKKVLGGYLISMQKQIFTYLERLETIQDDSIITEAGEFLEKEICVKLPFEWKSQSSVQKRDFLFSMLNRPVRVCGMVRNQGEPGGHPFWVEHKSGIQTIQIVESFQINKDDHDQKTIFSSSTHFNPVDLVCSVRDYRGNLFDLTRFRDAAQNFISVKSWKGREIKMLELPGLWNGGMADWNTFFIDVPLSTFNPVKTILDLLRKEHQLK